MKFAHLGDCHLGGWRHPELKELNFKSFQIAVEKCIKEKVEFVLIAGDLFDSPYPSIEILKETFREFRKLKESGIPVFLIAGSHDYSVSGKTFLEVLEKSGFCTNVAIHEERNDSLILIPTLFKNVAIYGYPGKKSALEVEDIEKIKLQDAPGLFKILMLHTAIRDAVGNLPIKAVDERYLPKVDYLALGHLHIHYQRENRIYSGPIFPNTLSELEELKGGSFYIFNNGQIKREDIAIKKILSINFEAKNAFNATEEILALLEKEEPKDKIIILKLFGVLEKGKITDIDFLKIESYLKKRGAFFFLKSTSKLFFPESEFKLDVIDSSNLETEIIKNFEQTNPSKFNYFIPDIMKSLQSERKEDEKSSVFEERLLSEMRRILKL
ncbi:MAG: DNA repair exonuclease [archaeon]|nr:DNA repair exonuclease [archaeon]